MAYGTLNAGTITPGSGNTLSINESVAGTAILDEDAMGSDSATKLATQQSIKAYVDSAASQATTAAQGVGTGNDVTHNKLTATTGVLFGTDTAAANTLDDYEEGTFTATLTGSGTDPSTPVTTTGYYTKTGDVVNVSISFANVNTTGASGDVRVTGLPFNSSNKSPETRYPLSHGLYAGCAWAADWTPIAQIQNNSSIVFFYQILGSTTWNNITHNATAGVYIWLNGHYLV